MATKSAVEKLAGHARDLKYDDLPKQAIEIVKRSILDTLGCVIAGSSAFKSEQLVTLLKCWGRREEATVLVYGGKVPAPLAALANCTMARALDLDDTIETAYVHPNASVVPCVFAFAEYGKAIKNRVTNGKDLLLACVLGTDLLCRLRMAGKDGAMKGGWVSDTFAPIAVAAMGARMLGLDETKMMNAMGIAYAQSIGNIAAVVEGAMTVRLQQGFGAQAAVMSVILADEGFTGARDILEGKYGLYSVYTHGDYDPALLTGQLGERLESSNVSIKPYPSGKFGHGAIYGALILAQEHNIRPENVEKVTISTCSYFKDLLGGEDKVVPSGISPAHYSFYYTVASALVRGHVFIEDFTEDAIKDRKVLDMARRVKVVVDPHKDGLPGTPPTDIEIETKDGKHYTKTVEFVPGHPKNPLSMDDVIDKMRRCTRFSAKPLAEKNIGEAIHMVKDLDKVSDVTGILPLLT